MRLLALILSLLVSYSALCSEHILFVLTTADKQTLQNGKVRDTGFFLGEFYIPYRDLINSGHTVSFATIDGQEAPIDPESLKESYWNDKNLIRDALEFTRENQSFKNPATLKQALRDIQKYDALVIPGGQGVMVDLIENQTVTQMIHDFAIVEKPIGLICHSPALLLNLAKIKPNPLAGFSVTSVSIFEELYIENFIMKGKAKHRMLRFQLENSGYEAHSGLPKSSHVEKDKFLVTNQNPYSSEEFSQVFLKTLLEYSQKI